MEWIARALFYAACALAGAVGEDPGPAAARPATAERAGAERPGRPAPFFPTATREEHFVLELVDASGSGDGALTTPPAEAREIGLAVLRRHHQGGRLLLEWDLRFAVPGEPDTRVHHVEVLEDGRTRFVWREYRPGSGRTLFIDELAPGQLRSIEWGGRDGLRADLEVPAEARFPLRLVEDLRTGRARAGVLPVYDPLTGGHASLVLETRAASWAGSSFRVAGRRERTALLSRTDGTLAGAYRFEGVELVAFQWQAGGARGRRIPADAWRRRLERLDQADRPALD